MFSTSFRIALESLASSSPYILGEMPIDCDSRIFQEGADKSFGASGRGDQLGKYRCGNNQIAAMESSLKRGASGRSGRLMDVP